MHCLVMAYSISNLCQTNPGVASWCSCLCAMPSPWIQMGSITCFQLIQYSKGSWCLFGDYTLYGWSYRQPLPLYRHTEIASCQKRGCRLSMWPLMKSIISLQKFMSQETIGFLYKPRVAPVDSREGVAGIWSLQSHSCKEINSSNSLNSVSVESVYESPPCLIFLLQPSESLSRTQ